MFYKIAAIWGNHEGSIYLFLTVIMLYGSIITKKLAQRSRFAPFRFARLVGPSTGQDNVTPASYKGDATGASRWWRGPNRLRNVKPPLHQIEATAKPMLCYFILFILMTSNPFLPIYSLFRFGGPGLNPILQDVGLIIHPPILYFGYVGTIFIYILCRSVEQATMSKSGEQRGERLFPAFPPHPPAPPNSARQWCGVRVPGLSEATLRGLFKLLGDFISIPWIFLTMGILLGSWWAYYELGWGGWWFWDPVENLALLPWLLITLIYHNWKHALTTSPKSLQRLVVHRESTTLNNSPPVSEATPSLETKFPLSHPSLVSSFPRGRWERQFPPPSPFLVATYFTFISALFGTLLIRIGVFNSVHSFASLEVVVTGLIFLVLILGHLGPGRPGR